MCTSWTDSKNKSLAKIYCVIKGKKTIDRSEGMDSNPGPLSLQSGALSTELSMACQIHKDKQTCFTADKLGLSIVNYSLRTVNYTKRCL